MFERFTDRARRVLVLAQEEARLLDHNILGTEHLLLGLLHEGEGVAATALRSLGLDEHRARSLVEGVVARGAPGTASAAPPFTPRAKKVLELSLREALDLGHNYIGTEHLLLGLIREGEGVAPQVLVEAGVSLRSVRDKVLELMSTGPPPAYAGRTDEPPAASPEGAFELGLGDGLTLRVDDPALAEQFRVTIAGAGVAGKPGRLARLIRAALAEYLRPPDQPPPAPGPPGASGDLGTEGPPP